MTTHLQLGRPVIRVAGVRKPRPIPDPRPIKTIPATTTAAHRLLFVTLKRP